MLWQRVESETVAAIAYDLRKRALGVRFRESGCFYLYFDVPAEVYAEFIAAESKGEYLNRVLKRKGYRYAGPLRSLRRAG